MNPDFHKTKDKKPFKLWEKPQLEQQTTTLWEYPSQHYGVKLQGHKDYTGATPSYIIWNLRKRYTDLNDIVLDPMCGSGTTLDVCKDLKRKGLGFDLTPYREDIKQSDARKLPLGDRSVDFIFLDPPYSDHIQYSEKAECIGNLNSQGEDYYKAMEQVFNELHRVLRNGRYLALYVCDSYQKGKPFSPIGFELFSLLRKKFQPIDIISVVRHNKTLKRNHWHTSAIEGNYYLRGFNYLFIFKKEKKA